MGDIVSRTGAEAGEQLYRGVAQHEPFYLDWYKKVKVNEVIDTRSYKWGPKAICEGQDYEVGAWGAPRMVYKWYRGDVDFKWFSCRQIEPNLLTLI